MNIAIIKVIIQAFVEQNEGEFDFRPGDWKYNISEIDRVARNLADQEIVELLDHVANMGIARTMFLMEA